MSESEEKVKVALQQITDHMEKGLLPFWLNHGIDQEFGGYLTCFDSNGRPTDDSDKYIVTQTRMIWGLSAFYKMYPNNEGLKQAAEQGVRFFIRHFWDSVYGGWHWKVKRDGTLIDNGKLTYGQCFAIYALSEYSLATGDPVGIEYAEKTFDLMQKYCADTERGGYYENLEPDWSLSEAGFHGGDRKSLDIHMHIMEAYTTLAQFTQKEIHFRKLEEVIGILLSKMIHPTSGCGLNQFDLEFNPIPAISIRRTWNAERKVGEALKVPMDTTSYGHNVELAWLLTRAGEILGKPDDYYNDIIQKLVDHAIKYGLDQSIGGVYRDGPHEGDPVVRDKEWWQNSEVLVGFLDAYTRLNDEKYLDAFMKNWSFDYSYMINHEIGEWYQLLDKEGNVLVGDIGNPWKAIYHTGRSMMECKIRLEQVLK